MTTTITPNLGANGYLDPSCKGVTAAQKDMIGKHGFHVSASGPKGSQFQVVDPVIVAANPGSSKGTRVGDDLDSLLRRAHLERQAHITKGTTVQPEKTAPTKPATAAKATAKASDTGDKKAATTGKAKKAPAAAELKAGSLDNTGKREKAAKKEKAPKAPKENRYERAASFIIKQPDIKPVDLAVKAGISVPAATYCIEAWIGITNALIKDGLKVPQRAEKKPAKAETPAAGK